MIRVVYRWKVPAVNRAAFLERWKETTNTIHETTEGALGSFCLQGIDDEDEILTVALWKSEHQWRQFIAAAKTGSMRAMHDLATQVSVTPYRQLGDETVL